MPDSQLCFAKARSNPHRLRRIEVMVTRDVEPDSDCFHAVRFYRDAEMLAAVVAEFIVRGIADGEPAVIIATRRTAPPSSAR